ncbi:amino acid adenylation domain-containing protein [Nocardia sp. CDC159]|uniref:Amino acid adenylation domain-containing protein n=1 Tax=Nocardia pulmonis TaxID=2951408 RepID=A0A9X2E877_9NOCA|nr:MULTISPECIES: non-ribosomal peptide synthetase [Nocardia]MCM6775416.1 amino acid adenylation domain-containing protein [Nocardia pulmonis]MCM6787850.1 amino acid adenylation domain-containing protein [Nocardia sp. CDC159]
MSSLATDRVDQCSSGEFSAQPFALSPAQTALWYAQRIRPDVPLTIAQYVEIHGDLDVGRLLYAIERFGAESQVGQVRLLEIDGIPHQVVDPARRPGWARIDLRHEADPRAAALRWMNEHASSPLDLERDPLTANVVLRVGDRDYIWYSRAHHIVIDGYGAMNASLRTAEIYTALENRTEPVASRATPLAEIYAEESRYRDTSRFRADREYWLEQLAGVGAPMSLSGSGVAASVPDAGRRLAAAVLDPAVASELDAAAAAFGTQNPALIVAALACYVRAATGNPDVVLSLPVSARTTVALRRSAGVVSNVVPIRVRFDESTTLREVVRAAELQITGALRHQRYRHDDIRRDCGYSRDSRGFFGPMVNIMLFHSELKFGSLIGSLNVLSTGPVEDLSINLYNGAGGRIHVDFEANPQLYGAAEVAAHHGRFLDFLARILAADPDTAVVSIPVITDDERDLVLRHWNSTAVPRQDGTLAGLFAERAAACPDAIAVEFGDEALTYAELSARANRLARALIARGAGPDTVVGLAIRRSLELLVGMYAIDQAGAAYLPIDPDHPAERIGHILDAARPLCVLTAARDGFGLPAAVERLDVDTVDVSGFAADPITDRERRAPLRPDHLAYVIFTSGSTGKPKGVGVSHAAIVNRLRWMQHEYPLDGTDVVLQKTPATFDVSVWEFFWPLQIGAKLVVAAPDGHRDPAYLAGLIAERGVTTAHFVPSMLSVFVTDTDIRGCACLRRVFCSGEALPAATVRDFHAALGDSAVQLHNLYGPTEAAVDVTYWACTPDEDSVPIGAPVWNTQVYVLDERLRPVPPGVVGELYLAGVQLARGYLGRPGLTADRFVANPFGVLSGSAMGCGDGGTGSRLYRTGDLVRWRVGVGADGVLEYLGRSDFQVKIRGLRIELGEIEAALVADARVARAVCVAHTAPGGDELVAYVVAAPGARLDTTELTGDLRRRLPGYMVPAHLRVLDELPLNPNGKVDRKALPAPELGPRRVARAAAGPRTEVERRLAAVFAEVLGVDDIDVTDSFFDLGGNSLSAARAVARINAALSAGLTIRDLFESATIAALAARLDSHNPDTSSPRLVAGPRPEQIPLSLAQQRLWILNRFAEHASAYNMPLAVELTGPLDPEALRAGLIDVLERHESLRTTFPDSPVGPVQVVHPPAEIPLTLDPIDATDADALALATEYAGYGFDLRSQAPIRVALYATGPQRYIFLVVLHHICGDGWSVAPLARDLMTAVAARAGGHAPQWTPLPVQYADFALWQRELLGDETDPASALSRQLAYWRAALADLPDQLDLPLDRPRPLQRTGEGARVRFTIPASTRRAVAALAADRGVSTFMVLHAALATLLARLCNTTDIAIGTPIAGRSDPALDDLVGMFVNTLVLRTRVDPAAGFDRMLDRVRETDLDAFANSDVPFERLVEVVNPARDAGRHPLFQVMLSYESAPDLRIDLPEVSARVLPMEVGVIKFDLQLTVHDTAAAEAASAEDGPLTAEFGYATDVFDTASVEAIARRFVQLLTAAVAAPSVPVGDLSILDARETGRLVPITGAPGEPQLTLARLLSETAERLPDAIAVRHLGRDTSYRELDERSNRLARVLIEHGAGPEVVVAIALPRGLESILAVWAVAKTGAAYVPVDPDYPAERIAHMLSDSGAMLGLTNAKCHAAMPDWPVRRGRHRKQYVDWLLMGSAQLASELSRYSTNPVTDTERHYPLRISHPAYLIYTSGSTGAPKAVVVTHAGLASLAHEQMHLFGVTDSARTLHFSSPSFDASVLELLLGFAAGATIVVAPAGMYGGAELAALLREERVTHAFITPAALATVPPEGLDELEAVIVGGDACPEELVQTWTAGHRMHNMYGPSEATVAATATGPMVAGRPVPIGLPVRGMRLFVLDARLHPVPPGVPGELYLSGPGLARGYLGRSGLTAVRFPANPHGRRGERMYRTGDLVVADATGQLRFLGRADDQVKIRGFRIELREIDHVLRAHPDVRFALTVVHNGEHGSTRLASYVTTDGDLDPGELLATARKQLPGYMVPAAITVLDQVPVSPSGKLDRKALPEPQFGVTGPSRAPETELERQVARVFETVLGHPVPGAEDSFFDIGGNSLLATRLTAALHDECGVDLPVRVIFEAPTVAGVAARLADAPRAPRLTLGRHEPRPARVPLSLPQQRMWFLNRYSPESSAYNIAFVLGIEGELDVTALRAALTDVIDRHEVLRTVFPEDTDGGDAYQHVLDIEACVPALEPVPVDDAKADRLLAEFARRGFDLTVEPPLRMLLLRDESGGHRLGIVLHHIAADGWSLGPLTHDLAVAYAARRGGVAPAWAPLPVQYADYALWQRDCLGDATDPASPAATQLAFWRETLAELPQRMSLPYDRPRPAEPTQRADTVTVEVSEQLAHRLEELARAQNVSRFMVLRSALAVLLRIVTGGRDVVIGTPIAGRTDTRLDELVGMFVNTLVLRSLVDPDRSFAEQLQVDRDGELAAMAHADLPFDRITEEFGRGGANPLVQVALTVQDAPTPVLELPGLRLRADELDIAAAKFDLELRVPQAGGSLEFVYAAELFDHDTVRTLADRLHRVLDTVAADPQVRVRDIDARTDHERSLLAPAYGPVPTPQCSLANYFAVAAHLHAERTAIRAGDIELSYGEVDAYSNRLARALIRRGLGPGDRVAMGLTRSVESVVAMLAISKAGAAFVPTDPNYPTDRLRHMLTDSGCRTGVTLSAHVVALREAAVGGRATEWLLLDDPELMAEIEDLDDSTVTDADRVATMWTADLAYVIYTSGSTGKPKGVAVTHGGLSNFADEIRDRMRVDREARTLHFATPSFDAAIFDLLLAVGAGATMVICPTDVYGGDELAALMDRERVSHTFMTPAALATIDHDRWPLPHLRALAVGGEALGAELVARWAPNRLLLNVYGPTETTVVITLSAPLVAGEPITIGTPARGARALVLDERLRAVPVGVPGELYLGGQALARGYLDRSGLTATRFVADPYGPEGTRMYRTGDVVRWNARGELVYLGRSDHQVKVRGFRIELGEISEVLSTHPAIRFAHTEVREIAGARRLVSYVLPADPRAGVDAEQLRAHVAQQLPAHMVPASITALESIPLTPVGKLDRAALPQPRLMATAAREPESEAERLVATVMAELVGADGVGADDSFFDVGGNSLLATQLVARLAAATGVRLEVRTVFAAPTVAELATLLEAGGGTDPTPQLRRRPRPPRIPLSAAQRRLWFLARFNESAGAQVAGVYNVPVALRLRGELDVEALRAALHAVQRRHETLRTIFGELEGEPFQRVLDPAEAAVELPVLEVAESEVAARVTALAATGFELAAEVPVRARLLRLAADEHVLVLVVHHIAMDGWSLEPLAADVAAAYTAHRAGAATPWGELPVQYADYTLWQRETLGSEDDPDSVASRQLEYWRGALAGIPELLAVPADRPRPPAPSYRGGTVDCTIDARTHRELQAIAQQHGVTMFMVLHAALATLLHRLTAVDDITVGTPIAGRGHPALDPMVGMFVNTLVLRTRIEGGVSFAELLAAVREVDLEAFAHADVPFERLVEVLNPARSQAHHPMFQVMLSVRNQPVRVLELPELRIEAADADPGIAKFDLQFTVTESWSARREPDGITVSVNFARDLFDEATAAGLGARLVRLLTAAAANPALPVGDLELLDGAEWSSLAPVRGAEPDRPLTLPEVFEAAARVNPQAVALRCAGTQITYDALDRWTNRLARVLIALGVGPETLVALGIPRSAESVAVTLAVAKAGAAFVPIDPTYPEHRIAHMLTDSGAALGITLSAHRERMPDGASWTVLDAPSFRRRVLRTSDAPITAAERPMALRMDNPAYVIYTSGSTGVPKGVVVTHGGLSNFAAETAQRFDVRPGCRVLHFATPSFDAAMLDLLMALGGAATLVIAPAGVYGGAELARVFIDEQITHAFITTAALGTVDPTGVTALRHVLVGGEALPPELVNRWGTDRNLYNVYGPTETTIVTVVSEPMSPGMPVTIGGPIRGVAAMVLDARLHPAPAGVTGELYLAGPALARGYLHRPGLTAGRFVANPYGKPGERMYRTGDLVRWVERADRRDLEYVGRTDHQVKIRGFRIELGEIDAALAHHPAVEFATTMGYRTPAGSTALVAYVKPRRGHEPTVAELTAHVAELVPNYMVPQAITLLNAVPLTPVGKLDRKALPEPVFGAGSGYRAPSTPVEAALCAAFAEVLGVASVGADDGFFELGGNSLLATKVVAQLRSAGIELPVQLMFGDSSPAAIARRLAATAGDALAAALEPLLAIRSAPGSSAPPLFCVHPAIGLSWCYSGLLAHLPADRPVYGLQAPHVSGGDEHASIAAAAKDYVAHIKSVQPHGPYHLLGWSLGGLIAQEIAVRLQEAGEQVALLALMDSYQLSDEWLEHAIPGIADIIGEFGSDLLGGDHAVDPRLTLQDAAELLRNRPGPFAALTVEHLQRLYTGYANGAVLAHGFRPRVFDGDLLFFTAADDEINRADPTRCAQAWEPYVTGAIHDQKVRCRHSGMTTPEALAVIGPVLRDHLGGSGSCADDAKETK